MKEIISMVLDHNEAHNSEEKKPMKEIISMVLDHSEAHGSYR